MAIGDRIRQIRLNRELKQSELATRAQISRVSLGFYERGERIPPSDTIVKLASVLDVPVAYLLLGTVDKEVSSADARYERALEVLKQAGFSIIDKPTGLVLKNNEYGICSLVSEDEVMKRVETVLLDAEAHQQKYINNRLAIEFDNGYIEE